MNAFHVKGEGNIGHTSWLYSFAEALRMRAFISPRKYNLEGNYMQTSEGGSKEYSSQQHHSTITQAIQ